MHTTPMRIVEDQPNVLSAVRQLLSQHPHFQLSDAHDLAGELQARNYLPHRPHEAEVEGALAALVVEDVVLA